MIRRHRFPVWAILAGVSLLLLVSVSANAEPVIVEIVTNQIHSSPDPLQPFDIKFVVHANGNKVQGMVYGLILHFTNGNFMGTIDEWPHGDAQVVYSAQSIQTFASKAWSSFYGHGTDPDTMLLGVTSFSEPWKGSGEMFRIHVVPTDTGSLEIEIPFGPLPPAHAGINALDPLAQTLEVSVINPIIRVPPQPDAVRFRFSTSSGTDTVFVGSAARIFMNVDPSGQTIQALATGLRWTYSNGNFVGPFSSEPAQGVSFSPTTLTTFTSRVLYSFSSLTDVDTSAGSFFSIGSPLTDPSEFWLWSVEYVPVDTGTVVIDSNTIPPGSESIAALNNLGAGLPCNFIPGRIVVLPCPFTLMGDVNANASITSSDLIYLVNYVFKSGPDPLPERSVADVNCSGGLGGADIIYLVNYLFKSGAEPCACIVRRI